ncbi:TetR/AcrR family transcriptional regulator [Rhizorhabdus phycosphaerae]|uniref:TetR/AcrR family transcriptional regulator n=1 Tax=Rhizorhabdus phycosphaerae TaxID=2711156 RepID=UPI001D019BC7|nr:TetR/AcrR family transcriptional regulator [Rhizorhabdus phycosphaerae]
MKMTQEKIPLSRREARRQDRREAIIDVAMRFFLEHGYAAASMSAIAAEIGGSKATLWSYFPSKEALFEAGLEKATSEFRQRLLVLLDPCGDAEQSLRNFCKGFIERVTAPDAIALNRLIMAECGRFPEIGRIFYERAPRATQRVLSDFLRSMMERDRLKRADPDRAAHLMVVLSMAGCHHQLLLGLLDEATGEMIASDVDQTMATFMALYGPA